jgi:hypothetical protein
VEEQLSEHGIGPSHNGVSKLERTTQQVCSAQTRQGAPCRSFALPGGSLCIAHDPEQTDAVRAARAKGGAHASKLRALRSKRARLNSTDALVRFTDNVIQDAYYERIDPNLARALLYGVTIQGRLLETNNLERRVAALEALRQEEGARR